VLVAFLVTMAQSLPAQISWSGIYDFEVKKGGSGSKLELNQLPNGNIQLNVQAFQLFVDATVDEDISISTKITTNRQTPLDPRLLNLELAYVTFRSLVGNSVNVSAGKILTPFGAFTRRQLSPDNPFIGSPLFFYYQTNLSPVSGYLDSSGVLLSQSLYGGRLSTIYNGGYYVGAQIFGSFADDLLAYNIAVMNTPLSSPNTAVNLDKGVAFHGRIAVHPAIWGTIGASYCTGSFIDHNNVNDFYSSTGGTEQFKQNTLGFDLDLSYLFYELNAEYIVNNFHAPFILYDYTIIPPYRSGLISGNELVLSNNELLVDVKIDAPFYPGLYIAGRYNALSFGNIIDPSQTSNTLGKSIPWDRNVQKFAVGIGYKPAHGVLIKLGFERTSIDVTPSPDLDIFATQLSIAF
jgi:hypothetical protein